MGSGDLTAFQLIAYVAASTTKPADPSNVDSSLQEHDDFNFFGLDLSTVHDDNYSSYVSGGSAPSPTSAPSSTPTAPSSTAAPPSTTSSAGGAAQSAVSQSLLLLSL